MLKKVNLLLVLVMLMAVAFTGAAGAQEPTGTEIAFVLDSSGSLATSEFNAIRDGLAAAIANPACAPQDGSLRISVIQFSTDATIRVPETTITAGNAAATADAIRAITHEAGFTNWDAAVTKAIESLSFTAAKQSMNFMSDGEPNRGSLDVTAMRDRAVTAGFDEINAEGVNLTLTSPGLGNMQVLVYPQPATVVTSLDPAPTPGWILLVPDGPAYANSICRKIQLSLGPVVPPPTGKGPKAMCDPVTPLSMFDKKGYTAYTREYVASATDPDTPVEQLQVFVKDSGSGTVWGPFSSGVTFKYNWDVRATPGIKPSTGNAMYIIKGTGPAQVYAVDPTPTMSEIADCPVHDNVN